MKAVIYARFSSDRQTEDSIAAQVRACREYADKHNLTVTTIYEDKAQSAKTDRRPEFQRMIRDAERGEFDVLLVHKYNRFARRMSDHVRYEDRLNAAGVDLIAVAEDFGTGKEAIIMKALMRSLSEYYVADLSAETQKGHREVALKGLHNGGYAPFGYDVVNQEYVINELEAEYVRRAFQCAQDRVGFTALLREMEERGIRGKRGKVIRYAQLYEILRNEKYTGTYTYSPQEERSRADRRQKPNAIRIENALPAIVSRAQFEEVQKIMDERRQAGTKSNYLCSGLVYCRCGAKMHGATTRRKGHEYRIFTCSARCGIGTVKMDEVDRAAIKYLRDLLEEKTQAEIADALRHYHAGNKDREADFMAVVNERIGEKRAQYDALLSNLSVGSLPPDVVTDVGERMQSLKAEIAALEATEAPEDFTPDIIRSWLEEIKKAPDEKAIHLLIERIEVKENKTEFSIHSTLNAVLGKNGCGGRI